MRVAVILSSACDILPQPLPGTARAVVPSCQAGYVLAVSQGHLGLADTVSLQTPCHGQERASLGVSQAPNGLYPTGQGEFQAAIVPFRKMWAVGEGTPGEAERRQFWGQLQPSA